VWIYPERSPEDLGSGNGTALLRLLKYQTWTYPWILMGDPVPLPAVGTDWHTVKMTFQGNNIYAYYDGSLVLSATDDGSVDGAPAYANGGIGLNLVTLPPAAYTFFLDNIIVTTNDDCVANYDAYAATSGRTLNVAAPGVLANDTGGGPLSAILVTEPANGSVSFTNNGGFAYTPADSFTGTDSFTYQCADGETTSSVMTVLINVNHAALANDDAYAIVPNTKKFKIKGPGVLANDQGGVKPLTARLATKPANGKLTLSKKGGFTYKPNKGFMGVDTFTYVATDGQSTSGAAIVRLNVTTGNSGQ